MHKNHIYNLISQLTQEHRSLWRIKKYYIKDSGNCRQCKNLWQKLSKEKERTIIEILEILKNHGL
ncbi:MAG: hypothetical protein KatS3mg095_0107 [Candidatus Parcubacteria bacterium]|nr:MAG: hypothetical protein KatS3mg095_0107 [Candidatus Parcubacteria bacterium]